MLGTGQIHFSFRGTISGQIKSLGGLDLSCQLYFAHPCSGRSEAKTAFFNLLKLGMYPVGFQIKFNRSSTIPRLLAALEELLVLDPASP